MGTPLWVCAEHTRHWNCLAVCIQVAALLPLIFWTSHRRSGLAALAIEVDAVGLEDRLKSHDIYLFASRQL